MPEHTRPITANGSVRLAALLIAAMLLAGCSTAERPRSKVIDYGTVEDLNYLEMPPGLSEIDPDRRVRIPSVTASETLREGLGQQISDRGEPVLPQMENMRIQGFADIRWLLIDPEPTALWDQLRRFWQQQGFSLRRDDPVLGILETDWAENRADLPLSSVPLFGRLLGGLQSADTRDRFRIRMERAGSGIRIYLSHRGMEEEVIDEDRFAWVNRPSDPELEAEMLQRLMVFLGLEDEEAARVLASASVGGDRAFIDDIEKRALRLVDPPAQGWVRVGIALARIGAEIKQEQRQTGVRLIEVPPDAMTDVRDRSLLDLFEGSDEAIPFQVKLSAVDGATRLELLNAEGGVADTEEGKQFLNRLLEQLR